MLTRGPDHGISDASSRIAPVGLFLSAFLFGGLWPSFGGTMRDQRKRWSGANGTTPQDGARSELFN